MSSSVVLVDLERAEPGASPLQRRAGLLLAALLFAALWHLPLPGLKPEAHRLAAVMVAVAALWITEALPLPVSNGTRAPNRVRVFSEAIVANSTGG